MNILKNAKVTEVIKPKMINTKDGQKKVSGLVLEETFTTNDGKKIKKYLKLDFWEDDSKLFHDVNVGQINGEVKLMLRVGRLKMVIGTHQRHQFNLRRRL